VLKSVDARLARALLARLPAVQRRLLLLRVVGGLSAEDTGYVLDMSPGPVRWPSTGPWSGSVRWPPVKLAAMKQAAMKPTAVKLAVHENRPPMKTVRPGSRTAKLGALGPGHPRSQ
jgi:hypothetical protein